jgi:replication factor A1
VLIAGDDSCDATFILFGRIALRLIRRPVESLIEDNPPNSEYIPSEIATLIDGKFVWNVSFTRDTVKRSQESLQVNSIVSTASSGHSLLLMPPDTSQATSAIVSAGSSSSVQTAPPVSETSTRSHQAIEPGHNASIPTKLAIGSTTHDTPTSKPCHSTPSKKNIVVSMCHVQSASPSLPTDTKVRTLT